MSSKERSFYNEMDQSHKKIEEKTLPFWKLTIFFLILIIVLEIVLFSIGRAFKKIPDSGFSVKGIKNGAIDLVNNQEIGNELETTISQGVLCSNLVKNIKKEVECSVNNDGIIISGKVSDLLPGNTAVYIVPKIVDGEVIFEATKVMVGSIGVSKFIATPITSGLSKAISSSLPINAEVKRIDLLPASMVIITSKKS
jgi:hypothetical protein